MCEYCASGRSLSPAHPPTHSTPLQPAALQGEEVVQETILGTWASFLNCPDIATKSINFIVVDWPSQQWTGAAA